MTNPEMHDVTRVETFYQPGVNPQSMDPDVSGDSFGMACVAGHALITLADGAWVKGYDDPTVGDIAALSSRAVVAELEAAFARAPSCGVREMLAAAIPPYREAMEALRARIGYKVVPPEPFRGIDLAKVGPQSAFVALRFLPDGKVEMAQVRDCLAVAEYADGRMVCLTPNQSELVESAGKVLGLQNEDAPLNSYQSLVKEAMLAGEWALRRGSIKEHARRVHKPNYFPLWEGVDAALPDDLSGEEGFRRWLAAYWEIGLFYNSATFLNNPQTPWRMVDGTPVSWAMFTGEDAMLDLTFFRTLMPEEMTDMVAIWLMSDGAFKQGDRGHDLHAMRELGPERFYAEVLLPRFDSSEPRKKQYRHDFLPHDDRVPMDVSILRVPLPLR